MPSRSRELLASGPGDFSGRGWEDELGGEPFTVEERSKREDILGLASVDGPNGKATKVGTEISKGTTASPRAAYTRVHRRSRSLKPPNEELRPSLPPRYGLSPPGSAPSRVALSCVERLKFFCRLASR